ncbi:molybdopterin-dependent oxidoreductase [Pontibaca methylaminivorans]|uniref:molybdopterin-dependent oxidoreductase n=1 Tax=Pontibaca methylaminivorans TaxID=515897 RepID=UPI002FDB3DE2
MLGTILVDRTQPLAWMRTLSSSVPGLALVAAMLSGVVLPAAHAGTDAFPSPEGDIVLTITGQIARANNGDVVVFDEAMLAALPSASLETTTVVTDGVRQFDGFLMRDLLTLVGADGETVSATALNDYIIDIPMEDFERFDVLVATHMDGQRLLPSDKGPLWIVYPRDDHAQLQDIRYDYRWVWQLVRLKVE